MPSRTARLSKKGCGFATPECRAQRDVAVHPRPAPPPPLPAAPRLPTTALGYLEIRWVVSFLTTQVDFSHAGDLKVFMDEEQVAKIERDMAQHGYLEGHKMAAAFNLLRSNDLIWPYVVDVYMKGKTPLPFDLLFWNSDSTRMPAANHSFYLRRCYINNDLSQRRIEIGGVTLDLSQVTIPVYHLAAREDHIAPPRSVFLGAQVLGGPVRFVVSGSGHIAGVVNPPARSRYQHWTNGPPVGEFATWLDAAEEHPGSWWPV